MQKCPSLVQRKKCLPLYGLFLGDAVHGSEFTRLYIEKKEIRFLMYLCDGQVATCFLSGCQKKVILA